MKAAGVLLLAAVVIAAMPPGAATTAERPAPLRDDDDDGGGDPIPPYPQGCVTRVTGGIWATHDALLDGQATTVSWSSSVPPDCSNVTVKASGPGLASTARHDSKVVVPWGESNGYAMFELRAIRNGQSHPLGNHAIRIDPHVTTTFGRRTVYIDHSWQVQAFVDAIRTPNTTVLLADHVNLDLSFRDGLVIRGGVHILGNRSSTNPGPRIFTTTWPHQLFIVGEYVDADGVRIHGIRLDGGQMGIADADVPGPIGIWVNASVNVEIGNNEIYGWAGMGVKVSDAREGPPPNRINLGNATAVWVHDNHIHHNRHYRELGYGVEANESAYVLIERNWFDHNRHALAAAGTDGIGYLAYNNFLGAGGGENWCAPGPLGCTYTHQFDVHGTADCGFEAYCGDAGEYFDYRYNTSRYFGGTIVMLRGKPDIGAKAAHNYFDVSRGLAFIQTEGNNLETWDNVWGRPAGAEDAQPQCDFDGDGTTDHFLSTGATWWFRGAAGHWNFLNTSGEFVGGLEFGHFDGDGRCDIRSEATGLIFSGGRSRRLVAGAEVAAARTDLVWQPAGVGNAQVWVMDAAVHQVESTLDVILGGDERVVGSGDFNADGAADLVVRNAVGFVRVVLLDLQGHPIEPIGARQPIPDVLPPGTQLSGVGDFNADGRSDLLWRHESGQLEMWFAGEALNRAKVTEENNADELGVPRDLPVPTDRVIKGIGDFDADGFSDILWWHPASRSLTVWRMVHAMHVDDLPVADPADVGWEVQGVADFDGDGAADILWRDAAGGLKMRFRGLSRGQAIPTWQNLPNHAVGNDWQIQALADFNADGRADILWRHQSGTQAVIWLMNGGVYLRESAVLPVSAGWHLRSLLGQSHERLDIQ